MGFVKDLANVGTFGLLGLGSSKKKKGNEEVKPTPVGNSYGSLINTTATTGSKSLY